MPETRGDPKKPPGSNVSPVLSASSRQVLSRARRLRKSHTNTPTKNTASNKIMMTVSILPSSPTLVILAPMRWNFHGLTIEGTWDDAPIGDRWLVTFSPRPKVDSTPDLFFHLALAGEAPPSPSADPDFKQGEL